MSPSLFIVNISVKSPHTHFVEAVAHCDDRGTVLNTFSFWTTKSQNSRLFCVNQNDEEGFNSCAFKRYTREVSKAKKRVTNAGCNLQQNLPSSRRGGTLFPEHRAASI
jgi:hypothetical protein